MDNLFKRILYDDKISSWEDHIPQISSNHTQIAGVLAGFTITILVLVAQGTDSDIMMRDYVTGLFLAAFFGFVGTGVLYSVVTEAKDIQQYCLFTIASALYYLSVLLSFSALAPLFNLLKLPVSCFIVSFIILSPAIGGYFAVAIPLRDLLHVRAKFILLMFIIALFLVTISVLIIIYIIGIRDKSTFISMVPLFSVVITAFSFLCPLIFVFFWKNKLKDKGLTLLACLVLICCTCVVFFASFASVVIPLLIF